MVTEATMSTTAFPLFCRQHTDTAGTAATTIETGIYTVGAYPTAAADVSSAASGGIIEARRSPPRRFTSQVTIFELEDVLP